MLRPLAALAAGALAVGGLAATAGAQDVMEHVEVHGYVSAAVLPPGVRAVKLGR